MSKNKYMCEVCGEFISDEEGVTTINGYWVCDLDTCRTLDNENDAIEKKIITVLTDGQESTDAKIVTLNEYEEMQQRVKIATDGNWNWIKRGVA